MYGSESEPDHLYVLVHGFNSKPGHLKYMAKRMRETLGTLFKGRCRWPEDGCRVSTHAMFA
jgi:hypothetical protein